MAEITFKEIYELVDDKTNKVLSEVKDLRIEFNKLEAGRLTRVESGLAELQAVVRVNQSVAGVQRQEDEDSPIRKLGYKIVEYIILAVIGAVLLLIFKNNIGV